MVPWYGDDHDGGAESVAVHSKATPLAPAPTVATHIATLLRYLRGTRGNIAIAAVVFALLALGTRTQQVYKWWLTVLLTVMASAGADVPRQQRQQRLDRVDLGIAVPRHRAVEHRHCERGSAGNKGDGRKEQREERRIVDNCADEGARRLEEGCRVSEGSRGRR